MRILAATLAFLVVAAGSVVAQEEPFAGGWRASGAIMGVQAQTELILQRDGSFSQQTAAGNVLVTTRGRYRVFRTEGILRLDIADYEPKEWCGPLGCTRITMPDGETHHYRFVSPNEMILRDASGQFPAVTYRRAF